MLGFEFVCGVLAVFALLIVVLARTQARRDDVPLVFRCKRCDHSFQQSARAEFPRACPACNATDWAVT